MFGRKQLVIDKKELQAKVEDLTTRKGLATSQVAELKVALEAEQSWAHERLANQLAAWEETLKEVKQAHAERLDELEAAHQTSIREGEQNHVQLERLQREQHDVELSHLRQEITHRASQNDLHRFELERLNDKYMALKHQYNWAYCPSTDTWTNEYFHLTASISKRSGKWDLLDTRGDNEVVGKSIDYSTVVLICNARSKDRYFGAES